MDNTKTYYSKLTLPVKETDITCFQMSCLETAQYPLCGIPVKKNIIWNESWGNVTQTQGSVTFKTLCNKKKKPKDKSPIKDNWRDDK